MKSLFKKLAKFQQECPIIHKGTQGYGYSYADLPEIISKINPLLKSNGLGFTQLTQVDGIKTIVFCVETGESLDSFIPYINNIQLKGMNDFQVFGSQLTYLKRYSLSSILGIVTDKDNDASGTQEPKQPTTPAKKTLSKGKDFDAIVEKLKSKAVTIEKVLQFYVVSDVLLKELKSYETI